MSCHYLLLCLCGIVSCLVVSNDAKVALIGGHNASEYQFPYLVSIFYDGKTHACGGAIIGDKHILTAAHCVVTPNGRFFRVRLFVLAGTTNQSRNIEPAITIEVKKIYVPSEFHGLASSHNVSDIAVLELSTSLALSRNQRYIRMLKLPTSKHEVYDGRTATIAGFGWNWIKIDGENKYGNNTDGRLRFAEAEILTNLQCQLIYANAQITDKNLCAKIKRPDDLRRGVCKGDSGSPLVLNNTTVIGILSRSVKSCEERKKSGIYTRVSHYLTFIENVLKGKIDSRHVRTHEPASNHV